MMVDNWPVLDAWQNFTPFFVGSAVCFTHSSLVGYKSKSPIMHMEIAVSKDKSDPKFKFFANKMTTFYATCYYGAYRKN